MALTEEDKQWIASGFAGLRQELAGLRQEVAHLLRLFADHNVASDVRFRKLEAGTSNIDTSAIKRVGELERRVTEMDFRIIRLEGQGPTQQQ